jgi:putative flavoprotein involved in K+ transport
MTTGTAGSQVDVLVIGGGQAGLAMGYHLAQSGQSFQIVDAGAEIGQAWQSRWDSLQLFTSGRYDNLPGLAFPAAPDAYPGKDDVANYLRAYAAKYQLPVRLSTNVTSLTTSDGGYVAKAAGEALEARQVVVATGPFQVPFIPPIADALDPGVHQIHSAHYRRPETLPAGTVLVVGAANSGCQIAQELAATHRVDLSAGQRIPAIPQRPLGRDIWAWATALRLDKVTAGSRLGQRLAGRDQVIGPGPRQLARRHGIRIRPRAASAAGQTITFADGTAADYDAVVWATGYTTDHTWIDIPGVTDERGRIRHQRGVTPSPGLYMLGLTWQHTRGSALLALRPPGRWYRGDRHTRARARTPRRSGG